MKCLQDKTGAMSGTVVSYRANSQLEEAASDLEGMCAQCSQIYFPRKSGNLDFYVKYFEF